METKLGRVGRETGSVGRGEERGREEVREEST